MTSESKQVSEPGKTPPAADNSTAAQSSKDKGKAKEKGATLNENDIKALLDHNPTLKSQMAGKSPDMIKDLLTQKMEQLLVAAGTKNKKDMAEYKFWATQPVPKFGEEQQPEKPDGPFDPNTDVEKVRKEPYAILDAFEWVTMDLNDKAQMDEVYALLAGHYVEDDNATFRFNYSKSFLEWALKPPGWLQEWHVGVRAKASKKLCAFISGIPVTLRVNGNDIRCSEINFLCVHKKLRSKRIAPVLIKEITRRCNLEKIWQAVYTAGIVLPKPVTACRYFHRSLNWLKLWEVGFSPMPQNSTKQRQIAKYTLPAHTSMSGLREMEMKDVEQVHSLLSRYLQKFDIAPVFTKDEVGHWFVNKGSAERVIWSYVIEDPKSKKITDFFSFYSLESSVIQNTKHSLIKAAYLFYYATETAFETGHAARKNLKVRLNKLMRDALIIAKQFDFDVFNALTLLDNNLFLTEQKFGVGDGLLHYYLFNWRTKGIYGGLSDSGKLEEEGHSGVGLIML